MFKLVEKGYIQVPIAAGSIDFVKENTSTVAMPAVIVCRADMKADIAYNMTRGVWEQRESFLYPIHPIFKRYVQPEVVASWNAKFKNLLHPGAARYWKEQGLLK